MLGETTLGKMTLGKTTLGKPALYHVHTYNIRCMYYIQMPISNILNAFVVQNKFKQIFCGQSLYLSFSTHKQCIFKSFYTQQHCCVSLKPYTLTGFEPVSSYSWGGCDVQCVKHDHFWIRQLSNNKHDWKIIVHKMCKYVSIHSTKKSK
jgi:hypothetical protein